MRHVSHSPFSLGLSLVPCKIRINLAHDSARQEISEAWYPVFINIVLSKSGVLCAFRITQSLRMREILSNGGTESRTVCVVQVSIPENCPNDQVIFLSNVLQCFGWCVVTVLIHRAKLL